MDTSKSILQKINLPLGEEEVFPIEVKRDDLIDTVVSGNKWRKLKYNIQKAIELKKRGILTFGGAFSNHLVATAKACQIEGFQSIGIVRGEELTPESNSTLKECASYGMQLIFISRAEYKSRCSYSFQKEWEYNYPSYYVVPEGGKNFYGMIGCQEILQETPNNYSDVFLAGGTGTTAAGVLLSSNTFTKVHVISALKGSFLKRDIEELINEALFDEELTKEYMSRLEVEDDAHLGGYAKTTQELFDFINVIYKECNLPLEPIYTGKTLYHLWHRLKRKELAQTSKILFIHTGGLQSARTWKEQLSFIK